MTLRVSDFDQYILASNRIDYFEVRLGEARAIPLTFTQANTSAPYDISTWTFQTNYQDATATFAGGATTLSSVSNVVLLSNTPQTDANLQVIVTSPTLGQAVLTVPATVTSMPANSALIDAQNTLLKLITINATFPAGIAGNNFSNVYKLAIGAIIRFA